MSLSYNKYKIIAKMAATVYFLHAYSSCTTSVANICTMFMMTTGAIQRTSMGDKGT